MTSILGEGVGWHSRGQGITENGACGGIIPVILGEGRGGEVEVTIFRGGRGKQEMSGIAPNNHSIFREEVGGGG